MDAIKMVALVGLLAAGLRPAEAAAPSSQPAGQTGQVILDEGSWWRSCWVWKTPVVRVGDDLVATKVPAFSRGFTQPPAAGWMQADFDDSGWSHHRLGPTRRPEVDYGFWTYTAMSPSVSRQCLRGRFLVDDPAKVQDMKLSLAYRGGVVVYLNGREIARGCLPKDVPLDEKTLAEDYPPEAFDKADGQPIRSTFSDPAGNKDRLEKRIRRLGDVAIPSSALRKGVNVLALEGIRSPYHGTGLEKENHINSQCAVWATCGLVSLKLTASAGAAPNVGRPRGFHVWNLDRNDRVSNADCGDSAEPLGPIVLVAVRNGFFSGQVVAGSTEAIRDLRAEAGELKGPGTIPASAVRVRYALMDGGRKSSGAAVKQILVTVQVPKDAAGGEYKGVLTVSAAGVTPVAVPIELRVVDWAVPDPANFRTFLWAYESPTSVAMNYGVPEWSEQHWKYLEKSFELLGQLGNKGLHVPVVDHTQFGNDDGMIYWVKKEDGSFEHDFSVFDRFIKLAKKHCGTLDYVAMHVWHAAGWTARSTKQENTVTVIDKKTGARQHMQVPEFGTEEAKKFWTPVLLGMKERLAKEGMEKAFCLGTLSDTTAPDAVFRMFDEIIPDVAWHRGCHVGPPSNKKPYYACGKIGRVICHENLYGVSLPDPTKPLPLFHTLRGIPGVVYHRTVWDDSSIYYCHVMVEQSLYAGMQGFGRFGIDFWDVLGKGGAKPKPGEYAVGIYNRWPQSTCEQREPTSFRYTSPGLEGAVPNLRFEAVREGIQEAEALIYLSEAADTYADKIGKELVGRIRALTMERLNTYFFVSSYVDWYGNRGVAGNHLQHTGWQDRNARLFAAASEAQRKIQGK